MRKHSLAGWLLPRLLVAMASWLSLVPIRALEGRRQTIALDGTWRIQKGGADLPVRTGEGEVPVPGLTDLALHVNGSGDYWWYERTFNLASAPTEVALLKLSKAMFGAKVYLNGRLIDEYLPCFSPSYHDLRPWINFSGNNTLFIRIGERAGLPSTLLNLNDFEKQTYTAGIYDSVALILADNPRIRTVQTNPKLDGTLEIKAGIENGLMHPYDGSVDFAVSRADTGEVVARGTRRISVPAAGHAEVMAWLRVPHCQFWTPEQPFLYVLTTATEGDQRTDRFGMRTFRFNPETRLPELNGRTYAMLGTNICIYRFFEDPGRRRLPWDPVWVRALLRKFKTMHWNSMRLCIGPPPDFWYDLFDEEGILVQDESPIWYGYASRNDLHREKVPAEVSAREIVSEVTPCILDRCNHPSIFLWDLANETSSDKVKAAIALLRPIDLQGRRWEDGTEGYNLPVDPRDPVELHLYPFIEHRATPEIFNRPVAPVRTSHPLIVNEYGWLWLARDGSPTKLTAANYELLAGGGIGSRDYGIESDRRYLYATLLAADTEYLRSSRQYQIIHQFCGLSYSRPDANPDRSGQTSDNFLEPVADLKFDPYFESYVRDAFAPVGLCIERYDGAYPAGSRQTFPVSVYDDSGRAWRGEIRLMVVAGGSAVSKRTARPVIPPVTRHYALQPNGKATQQITLQVPAETGDYTLVAEYGEGVDRVQCIRDFVVGKQPRWAGKP